VGRWFALIAALVAAFALARASEQPPEPLAASAPADTFSAGRAMADVAVIAKAPHPVGSPANAAVRDHLLNRLRAMGLEARVQRTQVVRAKDYGDETFAAGGTVENVIGVLPGKERAAPALALMAHYDSVPNSPGAADDAAGVASALEIARAIKAQGTPARDVMLVLTDGEEAGLLGAQAFFDQDPAAKRIGFLINMESRGNGGRVQMFQTSSRNGAVIDLFRESAKRPVSSSLAVFLYENMPNDTDFTVSKAAGVAGLNYAFIGRQFDYHMASSTPETVSQATLQDMGDQVLAAAMATASAPTLPKPTANVTYSQLADSYLIAYPPAWGWGVIVLAGLLAAGGSWRAKGKDLPHGRDVLKGVGASLYVISAGAALLRVARRAAAVGEGGFLDHHVLLAQVTRWEIALALVALGALLYAASAAGMGKMRLPAAAVALAAGIACSAFGGWDLVGAGLGAVGAVLALVTFGRPASVSGVWAGVVLTGFVAAIGLQIAAPTTAFLVAWPLLLASLSAALTGFGARRGPARQVLMAALAAAGGFWLLGYAHGVFLGLDMPELLAVFAWLCALLFWPLAQPAEGDKAARLAALAVLLAGFCGVALVRFDPPWTARHPQPVGVAYHHDLDQNRFSRVSFTPYRNAWTEAVLTADGGEIREAKLPGFRRPVRAAPAKPVTAPAPNVTFAVRPDGVAVLTATPAPGARLLNLDLTSSVAAADVLLDGKPAKILDRPGKPARLRWAAAPQGITLTFRPKGKGELEVRYASITEAWPAEARPLPPRPAEIMPFDTSDSLMVAGTERFAW
jgi:hypothetical protein